MAAPIPNTYHLRLVAPTAAKPCDVCYKATPNVLITPDKRDFFYTCASHLTDRNFATPVVDTAAEEAKKKREEELEREIEAVKKEYEERLARRKKKKKDKGKKKEEKINGKRVKDDDPVSSESDEEDALKKKDQKLDELKNAQGNASAPANGPRVFELSRTYYNMRMNKIRNAQIQKRERAQQETQQATSQVGGPITSALFPAAPKGFNT